MRPAHYSHPALRAPCRLWSPDGEGATSCDRPWRVNCEVVLSCAGVEGTVVMGGVAFAAALRADFSPAISGRPSGPGHCPVPPLWPAACPQAFVQELEPAPLITFLPQFVEAFVQGGWWLRITTDSGKTLPESPGSDRPGRLILGPPSLPGHTPSLSFLISPSLHSSVLYLFYASTHYY